LVDLEAAVAGSTLPAAALPGTAGTVTVQVRNGGNVSANGIATIDVFASTDDELDGGDVLIGTMTARLSLAPEAAGTYAVRVALPADLDTGDYTLIARVTAQAPLTDANGDNNAGASDEAIAVTRPDLTATSCTASFRDVALPGERGTVTVEFANAAQVAARGHVNLVVYATTSGGMDGAEEIGRRDNTPVNLAPGQAASARIAVRLPSAEGDWRILAVVDDGDAMPETDTDNNAVLSARAVGVRQAFVDLVTLDPGVRAAALQPGRRYSATVTLRNDGNITATGAVEIKLYASADRTLSVADTELVVVSGKRMTLRPGATRPFRVSFTLPAEMPAGDYYLLAGILPDPRLSFLELVDTNLANNVAAAAAPFTVAA